MCSQDIRDKINEIGFEKIGEDSFYKEVDIPCGYNFCYLNMIQDNFLCIRVGKNDKEIVKTIVSLLYIKNGNELIDIVSRLSHLRGIFPQIVSVPEINVIL